MCQKGSEPEPFQAAGCSDLAEGIALPAATQARGQPVMAGAGPTGQPAKNAGLCGTSGWSAAFDQNNGISRQYSIKEPARSATLSHPGAFTPMELLCLRQKHN